MKCKIFVGLAADIMQKFNEWAKGKALTRDIIIHTNIYQPSQTEPYHEVIIAVYYPEGSQFDQKVI